MLLEILDSEVQFFEERGEAWVGGWSGGCGCYDFPAGPGCKDLGVVLLFELIEIEIGSGIGVGVNLKINYLMYVSKKRI